jgi:hypothetical protein
MKLLFSLVLMLAGSMTAFAQFGQFDQGYNRLVNSSENFRRATADLSTRAGQDILRGFGKQRADIENAFLAQQLDASANLFSEMVRSRRSMNELRDAASVLNQLMSRAPGASSYFNLWMNARNALNELDRDLNIGNQGGGNIPDNRPVLGTMNWRGNVDDRIWIIVRGRNYEVRTVSGQNLGFGNGRFTSPLPNRNVEIAAIKKQGRGDVKVIQQPSRFNNWEAIIEIYDSGSGARSYEVDIVWR